MASQKVPIREFKARLSYYLAQTTAGYDVLEITSHKKVVARVTGVPKNAAEGVAAMIRSGAASWGGGKPAGAQVRLTKGGRSLSDLVIDGRG